jgi:hypothetical protein
MRDNINYVLNLIKKTFPIIDTTVEEIDNEYFLVINSENTFWSEDFTRFVNDIKINYLFKNEIFNIFFSFKEDIINDLKLDSLLLENSILFLCKVSSQSVSYPTVSNDNYYLAA